ncbi:uncharacterized protein LOC126922324 [Bombus affinis]|uniref:uncharacterized protein LOC126922324 n=1 Tax=Bombus affinis TaxID=309941 RepID=UPI0021B7EA5A|nr:uncharacterized protein LOC126922324 [Bombus affinis]
MIKLFAFGILQAMMLVAVAQFQGQSNCVSLYGVSGQCIGLRQCPQILNILQTRPLTPQIIDILRQLQCGFDSPDNPRVCCPIQNGNINTATRSNESRIDDNTGINSNSWQQNTNNQNLQYDIFNNPLLPTECGKDLTQRIVGGERAGLDEYPWMTLLEYLTLNGMYTACGGVLISQRYVLTAAHCVKGKDIPSTWRLRSVRLGEYNTDTNPDCIKDDENSQICADEIVSVEIEEQIAHENYRPRSRDQKYDIALLRLSRDVTFTNYIKPICLPPNASLGQRLSVAGWGKTENGSSSNIKLKLTLPIVDEVQCQMTYGNVGVALGYGQICAGGQKGKDSCRGDSGGSLMAVERDQNGSARWVAVGVVSFGPSPCGMPGWPGVYTRVIDFVPWILSKMRQRNRERICNRILPELKKYKSSNLFQEKEKDSFDDSFDDSFVINMINHLLLVGILVLCGVSARDICTTPQNKTGVCINIHSCQPIVEILKRQKPLSQETYDYLISLQCGFENKDPKVCCEQRSLITESTTTTTTTTTTENPLFTPDPPDVTNHPNLPLLDHNLCGPISQEKIFGGNKTRIFDFPWMVLLAYNTGKQIPEFKCGGSLINKRYVLTAAHCITMLPSDFTLIGVRLGEHNLNTERDCDKDEDGIEIVCAERYQDIGIESTHFHPQYSRAKLQNDIGLLRLDQDADFRPQNVRPICMPIGSAATLTRKKVIVTGWGATERGPHSPDLLQVQLQLIATDKCAEMYERQARIWYKQMCAGGKSGMDSCSGDSGGPLQAPGNYSHNLKFIQYGVVSFGPRMCGMTGTPGVYTKIVYYLDWILDTIRA